MFLDKTRERETYSVGIIYFRKGQDISDVFENQGGTLEYQNFIKTIGWLVNLNDHVGFMGGLDPKVTGNVAPYFSNYDHEVIFQVATLMPNKEGNTKQIHKTRLINNNRVLITWTEDIELYKPPTDSVHNLNIVIHPLPSKLYLLKIIERFEKHPGLIGPALDTMVVSPHTLATIVRQTATNASRLLQEDKGKPFTIADF